MSLSNMFLLARLLEATWLIRGVLTLLVAIIFFKCTRNWLAKRRLYNHIYTVPTSPFLGRVMGHLEHFWNIGSDLHPTVLLGNVAIGITRMVHEAKEGLFLFRVGPFRHLVLVMNARTSEAILSSTKNIIKAVEYDFIKGWLGNGLLTGRGAHWKLHRKLLTPTFHFAILNKFIPVMNYQLATLRGIIESRKDSSGRSIIEDIRPVVTNCTLDIICQTAMGIQVNAQKSWIEWHNSGADNSRKTPESEYADTVRSYLDILIDRFLCPWLYPELLFRLSPTGWRCKEYVRILHNFTNNVIRKRKEEMAKKFDTSLSVEELTQRISEGQRMDFLDLMLVHHLKGQEDFDLESIREEVDTFMFGGHDTTSTTLHFALMLIGLYPEKQKLIHEEMDAIFGGDIDREITSEDIKQMPYLEMCIKETLRLYPPAAFFARDISVDFQCDKHIIPAGTTLLILSCAVHRDPEIYDKPHHYIPERFSPNSTVPRNPFAFIPFSAGPRNCIGQRFAMIELKLFLATILRQYSIRSLTKQEDILLDFAIISKSHTPIQIEFTRRGTHRPSRH